MVNGYFHSSGSAFYLIIFIYMRTKMMFSPFTWTVLQAGIFVVVVWDVSKSDRALKTHRLLLCHLQDPKHQSCAKGLSWGSLKDPNVTSVTDEHAGIEGWEDTGTKPRNIKHTPQLKSQRSVFLDSFIPSSNKYLLRGTRHYFRQCSRFRAPNLEIEW